MLQHPSEKLSHGMTSQNSMFHKRQTSQTEKSRYKNVRNDFTEDRKRNVELDLAASVGIIQEENDHLEIPTIPLLNQSQ